MNQRFKGKQHNDSVWYILILAGLLIAFLWKNEQDSQPAQGVVSVPKVAIDFSDFVVAWNDKVRAFDLSEAHMLPSTDNQKVLLDLKKYIHDFTQSFPPNIMADLEKSALSYPNGLWSKYRDFLLAHADQKSQFDHWDQVYSSHDLQLMIQGITHESDVDEGIKLVLASSDPCVFFELNKSQLWKRGLSANYRSCSVEQVDVEKFPNLVQLIK